MITCISNQKVEYNIQVGWFKKQNKIHHTELC